MDHRQQAAIKALDFVKDGMVLGLGTGRTALKFVDLLAEKLQNGTLRHIVGVPTSRATEERARLLGIPLASLLDHPVLDLAVDGADEVDPHFDLIKGLGRALLREKVVEIHAKDFVILIDETKLVPRLGCRGPLPVEIVQFEAATSVRWLEGLNCRAELWHEDDGSPVVTDNGNFLARCWFPEGIPDPYALDELLAHRPGVVEHGLFLGMATRIVVSGAQGVRLLEKVE
jgi:ribose 5-phosphate isomerase A